MNAQMPSLDIPYHIWYELCAQAGASHLFFCESVTEATT